MKQKETDLLICPFCGALPEVNEIEAVTFSGLSTAMIYVVGCENVLCTVQPCTSGLTIKEAIKAWNQRKDWMN